jgi:hypothetical protein
MRWMMPLSHHAPAAAARKAHLPALGPTPTGGLVWHRHFKGRGSMGMAAWCVHHASFVYTAVSRDGSADALN